MPDPTIEQRVIETVADLFCFDKSTITPQTTFKEDLDADSLDFVELLMAVEEEFDIDVLDQDADSLLTVGDVIKYVTNLKPQE